MILPTPAAVRTMRGRDLLKLGSEWFEAEGCAAIGYAERLSAQYGSGNVGDELRVRASANFAIATLFDACRSRAEIQGARRQDAAIAEMLVSMLRGAFTPPPLEAASNADGRAAA